MKYVMLAINGKEVDDKIYVRRVLLRYEDKENAVSGYEKVPTVNYLGTKLLAKDDYFNDATKNNQYDFRDDYYMLTRTNYGHNKPFEGEERVYHGFTSTSSDPYHKRMAPIEFEADSDEEAIEKFNGRDEPR